MNRIRPALAALVMLASRAAPAGITYDAALNAVCVQDFPEEDQPATLAMLCEADRSNGWNRMSYDPASNTYRLEANLVIGSVPTEGTYVQLGSAGPLPETLVVRGSVWIRSPQDSMKRPDGAFSIMNRLRLGHPADPAIRAALLFDVAPRRRVGLCIGGGAARGALHVYNSAIGVLQPGTAWRPIFDKDPDNEKAGKHALGWAASELRLVNSTVSDAAGWRITTSTGRMKVFARRRVASTPEYIEPDPLNRVEGCVFERCDWVFEARDGCSLARRCVFRECGTVFLSSTARAVECLFENNRAHWTLDGYSLIRGMAFIDCSFGPQQDPITLLKNRSPQHYRNPNARIPEYPQVKVYRTLLVKVVDAAGKPVPGALVMVTNDEFPDQVWHGAALTGHDGLTDADPDLAIQVVERLFTATETPGQPDIRTFAYAVKAEHGGRGAVMEIEAARPIPRPLVIPLK